jgi:hypothetical protein
MFDTILQTLIEEYRLDGHEVVEQEGVFFARLVLIDGKGVTVVTDQNLTRIADAAEARLASLKATPPTESHVTGIIGGAALATSVESALASEPQPQGGSHE